ncbi:FMN-binding negative transcriptional regulator [Massilia terrae]|uniref:FMN-binding negative transcriptional regulator n=1 Tax=Massilia terrae TaxID=1811224 RepID=A0ABT2CX82_9BURK|nr:FMN-binding negative transcriptional regulator [Massilia terrae]MCS0658593.1 FMN-binding negative transcriptional regulator [Massilia terrae]
MYTPRHFEETRLDVMHALIAAHPFGALVRVGPNGMDTDHLRFDIVAPCDESPRGTLRAHVARANPVAREAGSEVMVMFASPSSYVSPGPAWNYAVVHAHGRLRVMDDPAWLRDLVERLSYRYEEMLKAIVGIEIPIGRIEAKWKVSRARSETLHATPVERDTVRG